MKAARPRKARSTRPDRAGAQMPFFPCPAEMLDRNDFER
jgi:hypothetical protein